MVKSKKIRIIYMRNTKVTIKHSDLMEIGFPEKTAREIIKQAKAIAVQRFKIIYKKQEKW